MTKLRMARRGALALALVVLGGTAACGDDADVGASEDRGSSNDTGGREGGEGGGGTRPGQRFDVDGDPIAADDLVACLEDAGLEPEDVDTIPLGVEDRFERYRVELAHEGLSAELFVFESPAAATDARPAIALTNTDTERSRVVDNVVLDYSIIPSFDREGSDAVEGCIEG